MTSLQTKLVAAAAGIFMILFLTTAAEEKATQNTKLISATTGGNLTNYLRSDGLAVGNAPLNNVTVFAASGTGGTSTNADVAITGEGGTAVAAVYGVAVAGENGLARGGAGGTVVLEAGPYQQWPVPAGEVEHTAHTGDGGIAVVKRTGTAIVEGTGVAIALAGGVVSASDRGVLIIGYVSPSNTLAFTVGIVGANGLEQNVQYTLDTNHNFVPFIAP